MNTNEQNIKPAIETKPLGPPKSVAREYFESFVVTLIMAIFGMTFILQAVTVPTGSMQNTILIGDYLLVNKFIFAPSGNPLPFLPQRDVVRGDIIVFKYPGNKIHPENDRSRGIVPYQINYVKRVIGLPGETIEFRNNQVFINGQLLPEQRIIGDSDDNDSALETRAFESPMADAKYSVFYSEQTMKAARSERSLARSGYEFGVEGKPMQIPENHFFVMGDARDNSEDSRFWGFVPRELIVGRAMFVYWSCDRGAAGESMLGCVTNPRLDRIGKMIK